MGGGENPAIPLSELRDCCVDLHLDNQAVINSWHGRGPRSRDLARVVQRVFFLVMQQHSDITMIYAPSEKNPAEWFTREFRPSDLMLSSKCWKIIQREFGVHTLDLTVLDSKAMLTRNATSNASPHAEVGWS